MNDTTFPHQFLLFLLNSQTSESFLIIFGFFVLLYINFSGYIRTLTSYNMAEEEPKKVTDTVNNVSERSPSPSAPAKEAVVTAVVAPQEKPVAPPPVLPSPAPVEKKLEDPKALISIIAKVQEEKKEGSINRDAVLARVETEKRMSLIKAWEEAEKCKVENKAEKKLSSIGSWENNKKAAVEAELKKIEEQLEKKKAEYVELMKNKIAQIHKQAEEKRAMIEARRGEEVLKAEELAAKYRANGTAPKKLFGFM
ncbi:remorin 1.4-like isoform X2 [Raphanus sativus]|uniref:Remorin 1.4 isoform X2 n=1 Tax=Raphanus sativus TaxID=3726 RepID=A0A6J0L5I7_RAPSA|nr:remorin 1.4 isoform X2 [Raphanus sativus]XP_056849407.1 remorin 1.4-like isoform X2 [Raphanus sativus]